MNFSRLRTAATVPARSSAAIALLCSLGLSVPAYACKAKGPDVVLRANYDLVVLASVQSAERTANPEYPKDQNPNIWKITAKGTQSVAGKSELKTYIFTTYMYSEGCGRVPLPSTGERWVLYLDRKQPGTVMDALPLDIVRDHDPRLKNIR